MHQKQSLEFKLNTFSDEDLDRVLRGGSLFGWEESTYDAGSDLIALRFMFTARDIPYESLPLEHWLFSAIHKHELGHHILASCTRLGITLRKLSALLDGLILVVASEMVTQSGKVWLPFRRYLEKEPKSHISKLIRGINALELLRDRLTESWRIPQELFALCWSAVSSGMEDNMFDAFGWQKAQVISAASVISDKSRVDRVINSLDIEARLDDKEPVEGNVSASFYWQRLIDTAETTLDGDEKKEALEVLRAFQILWSRPPTEGLSGPQVDEKVDLILSNSIEEVIRNFAQGKPEHKEALAIFQRFSPTAQDAGKIGILIGIISNLYAPIFSPEESLRQQSYIETLPKIDEALSPILDHYRSISIFAILEDVKRIAGEIRYMQKALHSVTLKDLGGIDPKYVLGTLEWFESFYDELGLNRRQRRILRGFVVGSQIESEQTLRMLSTQGRKAIPKIVRPLFRLFLACRRWLSSLSPKVAKIYEGMESLGITSFRSLQNAIALYCPLMSSMEILDTDRWFLPSINVFCDSSNMVIALGADEKDLQVKHAAMRSLLDILKQNLEKTSGPYPVVLCPMGAIKAGYEFCFSREQSCVIRSMAPLFNKGTLFICSRSNPAKLQRLEQHPAVLKDVGQLDLNILKRPHKNKAEKHKKADLKEFQPNWKEAGNNGDSHPFVRAIAWGLFKVVIGIMNILGAPITLGSKLWFYGLERRQRKIDRTVSKSLSDISSLLKKLEDAPIHRENR